MQQKTQIELNSKIEIFTLISRIYTRIRKMKFIIVILIACFASTFASQMNVNVQQKGLTDFIINTFGLQSGFLFFEISFLMKRYVLSKFFFYFFSLE